MSNPASRSAARSAIVAFEPGRMTSSASPGSAVPGPHPHELDRGLGVERIEIVEIGDVRQDRHRDAHRARSALRRVRDRAPARPRPAAAGASGKNGTRPSGSQPVALRDRRHAVGEQRRIAAKFVDEEAADQRRIGRHRSPPWCRPGWRSRRRGRCRRSARPARRRRAQSPCWRCRSRAGSPPRRCRRLRPARGRLRA